MKFSNRLLVIAASVISATTLHLQTPVATYAALPGAHSNTVDGDVFIGGDYIELGLSKYGSFGTDASKPTGFYGTAARNHIGMSADYDGFDNGTDWRMDYFMPGTQEERWSIGYKINESQTTASNARRANTTQITDSTSTNQSNGNQLKATNISTHGSTLQITQVIEFEKSNKFFKNTVTLKNIHASNTLNSVRYMRSFDPDNTVDKGGSFTTKNTILFTHAAGDGQATVQADTSNNNSDPVYLGTGGNEGGTHSPILFYSSDSRARVAYHNGLNPGNVYTSTVYDSVQAKGSSDTRDGAISIAFDVGTLNPDQEQTIVYYTSLDSRDFSEVIEDIQQDEIAGAQTSTPEVSVESNSATISWTTDLPSSTKIQYGLVPEYGFETDEADISPRVTDHTVSLTDLKPCARYFYRIISVIEEDVTSYSERKTFSTTGCQTGNIVEGSEKTIPSTGGEVSHNNNDSIAKVTAPNNYHDSSLQIQINKLDTTTPTNPPSDKKIPEGNIYDLIAVDEDNNQVSSFNQPVTFTITYSNNIESTYFEDTLAIYKFNGSSWDKKDCTHDISNNTLTCSLSSFSVYALFGKQKSTESAVVLSYKTADTGVCSMTRPLYTPSIFQINSNNTEATLYIAPPADTVTGYTIEYGTNSEANQHAVSFNHSDKSGAVPYTIKNLTNGSRWYFKVKAVNGCESGNWSSTKNINLSTVNYSSNTQTAVTSNSQSITPTKSQQIENPNVTPTLSPSPSPIASNTPRQSGLHDVIVKVRQGEQVIAGAEVQLGDTKIKAITNDKGIAEFKDVPSGKQKFSIVKDAYAANETITVQGEEKAINVNVWLNTPDSGFKAQSVQLVLGLLSLLVLFLLILLAKKRRKEKNSQ